MSTAATQLAPSLPTQSTASAATESSRPDADLESGNTRGGRGNRRRIRPTRNPALSLRPASVTPTAGSSDEGQNVVKSAARARVANSRAKVTQQGRAFGGRLTVETAENDADLINDTLKASAPPFVPGEPIASTRSLTHPTRTPKRNRRYSKSTAPDIATRTHEDIDHRHYECPICTVEVIRNSKVWSCHTCWTVFHLPCIKKWSTNQGATAAQTTSAQQDSPTIRQWRCPGCNLPKDTLPKSYTCWCEKEIEPRAPVGVPPHSCGNTCGKDRPRKFPHPCELTCHAGPCPPCAHMGPTLSCFCGKHESTRRCTDTYYDSGWSCGQVCADTMPCGEHSCARLCHEGLCGACEQEVDATCYCGKSSQIMLCGNRGEQATSKRLETTELGEALTKVWEGTFACLDACDRPFDCTIHHCQQSCHTQEYEPSHCPHAADAVFKCPCGKTQLSDLLDLPRTACTDAIPNCDKQCGNPLPCGHACQKVCHSGPCSACTLRIDIQCRCGKTTSPSLCHQGTLERPQCRRVCRTTMSCGRHACDERCCPGERKAAERQSTKKKQRPLDSPMLHIDNGVESEHICTRVCGRMLKCGSHECQELCHKGPCGSCPEAIFHEIACNCGRTILQPPLPCGTKPPPCRYQCHRPKACRHAQVQHTCHGDDESCPKCPFLVDRTCMCGKNVLKHQQCWLQDVRCGEICGKPLKCGSHFCRKPCHKTGECEDTAKTTCDQACGKPKKTCGHPDESQCHAPFACKEDKPCTSKIFITCPCQVQKQEMKCGASRAGEGNMNKSLTCNDECARLERNRKLALALNVDGSARAEGGDHIPYSEETLTLFQKTPKWGQTQEREFRVFASSELEKRLRFRPMTSGQRAFMHSLATDFGLDAESLDPEPHRHVSVFKTPRFVSAPNKTLAECIRIRTRQRTAAAKEASALETTRQKASTEPFDSIIIRNLRFGLTDDDVRSELASAFSDSYDDQSSQLRFDIFFISSPSEEVLLRPKDHALQPKALESLLVTIKGVLATPALPGASAMGVLELCRSDGNNNILVRESDVVPGPSVDGWSRVAAKGAAPRRAVSNATSDERGGNAFSALLAGSKVTFSRRDTGAASVAKASLKEKKVVEEVADDWEAAEAAAEAQEAAGLEKE